MVAGISIEQRFAAKIVISESGCWLWQNGLDKDGYGKFWWHGQTGRAHRFAFEHWFGPIPHGLVIDHLCRARACVNPAHLEAVTSHENALRGNTSNAYGATRLHCSRGHALVGENLYITRRTDRNPNWTERSCRKCRREASTRHYLRKLHA